MIKACGTTGTTRRASMLGAGHLDCDYDYDNDNDNDNDNGAKGIPLRT
jgi:hypothetical protein